MTIKQIRNLIKLAKSEGITAFKVKNGEFEYEWVFGAAEINALKELREEQQKYQEMSPEQRQQEERRFLFPPV